MAKWNKREAKIIVQDLINDGIYLPADIVADVKQLQHGSEMSHRNLALLLYLGCRALPALLNALSDEPNHDLVKPFQPFIEEVEREIERQHHQSECSSTKEGHNRVNQCTLNDEDVVKSKCNSQANEPVTNIILKDLLNLGNNALIPVYRAYKCNDDFAKFLQPTVDDLSYSKESKKEPKWHPSEWPPTKEEHDRMKEDKVILSDIDLMESKYNSKDIYPMKQRIRGRVLIINNIDFFCKSKITGKLLKKREGTEHDEEQIIDIFSQLHFRIVPPHRNKTADEMTKIVEDEKTNPDHSKADCFICVIMSHGCHKGIYGVDGDVVDFQTLRSQFDPKNCPALNEKPKLFFVQACRGDNVEAFKQSGIQVSEDGVSNTTDGDEVDALGAGVNEMQLDTEPSNHPIITGASSVHAATSLNFGVTTISGYVSYRHQKKGSWFLQAVVWIFKYYAHECSILDMLTKVNSIVDRAKAEDGVGDILVTIPEYGYSLRKHFYFFPGMVEDPPTKP